MRAIGKAFLVAAICLAVVAARPETKVEVKGVHICCGACEKGIAAALDAAGVKGTCDKASGTVTYTAGDEKAAQKALDSLAAAGYHGTPSVKDVSFKDDSGSKAEKVKSLTVTGAHNCCGACCKAIKAIVAKVDGVKSDDLKPKEKSFTVTGEFDCAALVKALNDGGFHVKVEAK